MDSLLLTVGAQIVVNALAALVTDPKYGTLAAITDYSWMLRTLVSLLVLLIWFIFFLVCFCLWRLLLLLLLLRGERPSRKERSKSLTTPVSMVTVATVMMLPWKEWLIPVGFLLFYQKTKYVTIKLRQGFCQFIVTADSNSITISICNKSINY
jgi:hypothetical protein